MNVWPGSSSFWLPLRSTDGMELIREPPRQGPGPADPSRLFADDTEAPPNAAPLSPRFGSAADHDGLSELIRPSLPVRQRRARRANSRAGWRALARSTTCRIPRSCASVHSSPSKATVSDGELRRAPRGICRSRWLPTGRRQLPRSQHRVIGDDAPRPPGSSPTVRTPSVCSASLADDSVCGSNQLTTLSGSACRRGSWWARVCSARRRTVMLSDSFLAVTLFFLCCVVLRRAFGQLGYALASSLCHARRPCCVLRRRIL